MTVNWTAPTGSTYDWVGLFRVGASSAEYLWWQYTNGKTSGNFTMNAPSQGGQYEFRYHLSGTYSVAATSNAFTVQGTGLGLSIVRRYLDLIGGTISFTSDTEKGTTFTVELPSYHDKT